MSFFPIGAGGKISSLSRHVRRWSFEPSLTEKKNSGELKEKAKHEKAQNGKAKAKETKAQPAPRPTIPKAVMDNAAQQRMVECSKTTDSGRFRFLKNGPKETVMEDSDTGRDFTLTYGWATQTGYYPKKKDYQNQDNLLVTDCLNGNKNQALFSVFDGHGQYGAHISSYAVGKIEEELAQNESYQQQNMPRAFAEVLPAISDQLHTMREGRDVSDPHYIDDDRSGSTAICVMINQGELVVANVGDSRAIIGEAVEGDDLQIKAMPLSIDQTCFRADERQRCREQGAVIMTVDQVDGRKPYDPKQSNWGTEEDAGDDPPRLWIKDRRDPGIAFTRSIGDLISNKYVGCVPEPEILHRRLSVYDRFIVVASDGVFEFLSSQTVINIVSQFKDPQQAAKALVNEAYKMWLQYEVRTDDITAIVIFIKPSQPVDGVASPRIPIAHRKKLLQEIGGSFRDISSITALQTQNRPVRRNMQYMAKILESNITGEAPRDGSVSRRGRTGPPKSDEERAELRRALTTKVMFSHLNPNQIENIINGFQKVEVFEGERIIRQGDSGDMFFVVSKGAFNVFVKDESGEEHLVKTYRAEESDGLAGNPAFGELALIHGKPRSASVVAKTAGELFALDYHTFHQNLFRAPNQVLIDTLRKLPFFNVLGKNTIQQLVDMSAEARYDKGQVICREGVYSESEQFYVLRKGEVRLSKAGSSTTHDLSAVSYFGEYHIITGDVHDWTVTALSDEVICMCISRAAFRLNVGGKVLDLIKADAETKVKKKVSGTAGGSAPKSKKSQQGRKARSASANRRPPPRRRNNNRNKKKSNDGCVIC